MSKQLAISTFASVMAMAAFVLFSGPAAAGQAPRGLVVHGLVAPGLVAHSLVSQAFAPMAAGR